MAEVKQFTAENGFRFNVYDISEAHKRPERDPIIKNYFYEQTINLIYGPAGSMKTWWSLYEAICLTLGKSMLGMDVETRWKPETYGENEYRYHDILYITLEMTAKDIADRVAELCEGLTPQEKRTVNEHLKILSYEDTVGISAGNRYFLDGLGEMVEKMLGTNIIYIDSFSDYVAGFDLRAEDHMRRVINDLRFLTVNYFVSFRIIHHGTKTYPDGSGGAMAGIHTIRDLVDSVVSIRQNKDELTITNDQSVDPSAKMRHSKPTTLTAGIKSDGMTYLSFYPKAENEKISNMTMMSNILTAVKEKQGITAGELKKDLGKVNVRLRDSMIGTQLIMIAEKSDRGVETRRFYTVDYYNDHKEEIETHNVETGVKRG